MRPKESQRRAEEHFDQLVEGVSDYAIFLLDPAGHITSWNSGAERIKGYRPDEIVGQHFSRFYPEEAVRSGWPEVELRRAVADGRFEDEGWRVRKDGSRFWANVVITALRDESGSPRGFLKITRDLTARREAEEALRLAEEETRRANAELERRVKQRTAELVHANAVLQAEVAERRRAEEAIQEADRRKNEFLAMLGHELRNPLAPIRNALGFLKMPGATEEEVREASQTIDRQVEHLVRLVDDLLDVSRIMHGIVELEEGAGRSGRGRGPSRRDDAAVHRCPRAPVDRHDTARAAPGGRRPDPALAGHRQPARQRLQIHPTGGPNLPVHRA